MTLDPALLESRIRAIGEDLARRSSGLSPGLFDSRWWSQAAINLAMKDPAFKAQLFLIHRCVAVAEGRCAGRASGGRIFRGHERAPLRRVGAEGPRLYEAGRGTQWKGDPASRWNRWRPASLPARPSSKRCRRSVHCGRTAGPFRGFAWRSQCERTGGGCLSGSLSGSPAGTLAMFVLLGRLRHCLSGTISARCPACSCRSRSRPSIRSSIPSIRSPATAPSRLACAALNLAGTLPTSIIFDMEQAETKELILSIFMRLFEEESYRTFPMRVSRCRPTAPIPEMMCSACWHGPEPAGADDDPPGERRLLGFRCDPVSAARVADAAVRTEVPDRREL